MTAPARFRPTLLDLVELPGAQRVPRVVTVPSPAAGADWSTSVPPGVVWIVQSIRAAYVTTAVAGSRFSNLELSDGTVTLVSIATAGSVSASATVPITWLRNVGAPVATGGSARFTDVLWDMPIVGGWVISTATISKDAGDQWSSIVLYVIERRPPLDADLAGTALPASPTDLEA